MSYITNIKPQVQKFYLGQLPPTVAETMMKEAMSRYDNQQGDRKSLRKRLSTSCFLRDPKIVDYLPKSY